jgi:hypothetical protein
MRGTTTVLATVAEKRKPKADKVTARARVEDLARVILDGAQGYQVSAYVRQQEGAGAEPWITQPGARPLSRSQIRRYALQAEQLIGETVQADREQTLRTHLAMRRTIYARAVATGQLSVAASVVKDEAALLDLYPAAKREVSGPGGGPVLTVAAVASLTDAQRVEKLSQLLAAARARRDAALLPVVVGSKHTPDGSGGTDDR